MRKIQLPSWAEDILREPDRRARFLLNFSLGFNLIYAIFKLIMGGWYHSWWMIGLGVYYGLLAVMRFFLFRRLRKNDAPDNPAAWRAYRLTGALLLPLTIVIAGIIAQVFLHDTTYDYPGFLVYAFALYAFVKIISVTISLIKKRREENHIRAAARVVSFACALMSILALQVALLNRFGAADDPTHFASFANGIAGLVIVLLIVGISSYMIIRSTKALQEGGVSHAP